MKRRSFGFLRSRRRTQRLSLLSFFVGRVVLSGDGRDAAALMSLCMRYALTYDAFALTEDGGLTLSASYGTAVKICGIARAHGIALSVSERHGYREALLFCFRRPGLPIGALLAILLLVTASARLWEVRVTGNTTLSKGEVVAALSEAGLSLGDVLSGIDVDAIENRLLMSSERISWITVNLIGTVAEVQIREKLPSKEPVDVTPANLVARCDGVIVSLEVQHGNILTKVGTAVRAGEVLVSGLYDSMTQGLRYTRAEGTVYAETEHEFEIEVPYAFETVAHTRTPETQWELLFFGKRYSLYESQGFGGEDTVERISYLRVFGKDLPIGLSIETSYEAEPVTGEYSTERAMEIAYYRLSREISALPGMLGVLEKSVSYEIGETAYILKCKIRCIENIAETKNIEINLFE